MVLLEALSKTYERRLNIPALRFAIGRATRRIGLFLLGQPCRGTGASPIMSGTNQGALFIPVLGFRGLRSRLRWNLY